ncbi:TPA: glyoxylate/hydroxypyruvate reductase A [Escherichia coli]|uniref:D-3-phosphoglycerate dehydrogenase n=1 Tax=Klebsiella pneumoniae TaxID=573 RepID=A0A650A908_KLEPN|nr:glyoxylate/hydroxypyruvate reductase A [Klebsiella pneumoniae]EHJ6701445.1 glyoxylate/hydroxypyruvate reductase A [Escherichia coli]EIH1654529.1 glyoxylate/hydroxypyruvate reductase A [Escherichia coli O157]EKK38522.1 NAD binding domain of 6-phosphogluconate dehydrogenase family protein [Escherichia coli 8.0569]EKK50686.1 D-3-Phosphoglycerate dehydrogenase [Escherichia coli 8.0566]EKL0864766.1 glyoxylate/hydroxypyruvate reductase A [Salmonella enterica subsp. enterica serovar Schwarzengrund
MFYSEFDSFEEWSALLAPYLPGVTICRAETVQKPDEVHYALAWKPPRGFFAPYRNLRLLVNLGAGVDSLVGRNDLPDIPIIRLSDPDMARMMASYVLFAVLRYARDIPAFERAQRERRWRYLHPRAPAGIRVGVLGLGELGAYAARELARQGFDVRGWSRSKKEIAGIRCSSGLASLDDFLSQSDILVVMLPLTPHTTSLLSAERLARLPQGAAFINVSRGAIVDQAALTDALRSGQIAEATLDVFDREPLPPHDPLWQMDNVLITPHLASVAIPTSAARQVAENIQRAARGEPVTNQVFPERGY